MSVMRIELLTTGTELLLGTTQNTHGAWLGQELFKLGLRLQRQVTVPDGPPVEVAMADAVEAADVFLVQEADEFLGVHLKHGMVVTHDVDLLKRKRR